MNFGKLKMGMFCVLLCASTLMAQDEKAASSFQNKLRPNVLEYGQPHTGWSLKERMEHYKVPGVAVGIIRDGKLIHVEGYGVLKTGGDEKVNADTVFSAGSVSKIATAALTLKMVEKDMLNLDRNVDDYLTSWKTPKSEFAPKTGVTLRMLMSHTAGFNIHGFGDFMPGEDLPTAVQTLNGQAPATHDALKFLFKSGERSKYSGGGITVEQLVISDVSKKSFEETAAQYLFKPMNMKRSTFQNPLPASHGNIARAHNRMGQPAAEPRGWEAMPEMAASGLWISARELGALTAMLINSYREDGGFIPRHLALDMMTEVSPAWHGLGPRLNGTGSTRIFHHGGANNSYMTLMEGHLATGDGLVVLTNGSNGRGLYTEIRNAVADVMGWEIHKPIIVKPTSIPPQMLSGFAGHYSPDPAFPMAERKHMVGNFFDSELEIAIEENALVLKAKGRTTTFELKPLAPNRFIAPAISFSMKPAELVFHKNIHGKTEAFTFEYEGFRSYYQRIQAAE